MIFSFIHHSKSVLYSPVNMHARHFSILTEVQGVVVASTFSDVSVKVALNTTETSSDRVRTSCAQRKRIILSVLYLSSLIKRSLHFLNSAYTNWTVWACERFIIAGKVRNVFLKHAHVDCSISPEAASGHNVILPRYARMISPIPYESINVFM